MKNKSSTNLKRVVFDPFKTEGRVIYPIVDVLMINGYFNVLNISPVALIIEEKDDVYILLLTYDHIDDEELFELFSSFKQ